MKKFYSLITALVFAVSSINAQCVIDQNDTAAFNPDPDNVPCAETNVVYDQTLHFYIPTQTTITILGQSITVFIDSVVLNDVTGLPLGLNWSANPAGPTYLPDTHGCGRTQGTTNASVGNYPISFDGRVYVHATIPILGLVDTSLTIDQYIQQTYGKTYSIDVIAQGAVCHPTGINDFNSELNAAMSVYPNPSTGTFEVKLNAGRRVNGQLVVVDVTGKKVFTQALDVVGLYSTKVDLNTLSKGIYTVQLRTAEGVASKNISIE